MKKIINLGTVLVVFLSIFSGVICLLIGNYLAAIWAFNCAIWAANSLE